ncbi:MAG: hypothetical protein GXP04_01985 [Alphaproteobacteria bacterium]|nr:hypothetical protein [Alphaproteobacteria bacterium]
MKRRGVTPEEKALWRKATRDVAPLRQAPMGSLLDDQLPGLKKPVKKIRPTGSGDTLPASRVLMGVREGDPFRAGDPRMDRHVRRGRLPIDAVLDLHGHTQLSARTTLLAFLTTMQAQGRRCVLVITGKGGPASNDHDTNEHPSFSGHGLGRGVLRARMGDWLTEAVFRALITRASPAHPRHGGAGAFYVFLKPPRRLKR